MNRSKETKVGLTEEISFSVDSAIVFSDCCVQLNTGPLPLGKVCGTEVPEKVGCSPKFTKRGGKNPPQGARLGAGHAAGYDHPIADCQRASPSQAGGALCWEMQTSLVSVG